MSVFSVNFRTMSQCDRPSIEWSGEVIARDIADIVPGLQRLHPTYQFAFIRAELAGYVELPEKAIAVIA